MLQDYFITNKLSRLLKSENYKFYFSVTIFLMIGMKETKSNNGFQCPCRPITTTNVNTYLENVSQKKCFCTNFLTPEESKTKMKCHSKKIQEIMSNITISNRIESSNINVRCSTANRNGLGKIEPKINQIKWSCDDYKSDAHMLKVILKLKIKLYKHSQILLLVE